MERNADQNRQLHAIIGKLGLSKEVKEDLVYEYTGGRSSSSKDMDMQECQALINYLNVLARGADQHTDRANRMRRKIIAICHEMGWKLETGAINMKKVNDFCIQHSTLKKDLNSHTVQELPKLVTQFEQLLKKFYFRP